MPLPRSSDLLINMSYANSLLNHQEANDKTEHKTHNYSYPRATVYHAVPSIPGSHTITQAPLGTNVWPYIYGTCICQICHLNNSSAHVRCTSPCSRQRAHHCLISHNYHHHDNSKEDTGDAEIVLRYCPDYTEIAVTTSNKQHESDMQLG